MACTKGNSVAKECYLETGYAVRYGLSEVIKLNPHVCDWIALPRDRVVRRYMLTERLRPFHRYEYE